MLGRAVVEGCARAVRLRAPSVLAEMAVGAHAACVLIADPNSTGTFGRPGDSDCLETTPMLNLGHAQNHSRPIQFKPDHSFLFDRFGSVCSAGYCCGCEWQCSCGEHEQCANRYGHSWCPTFLSGQ